MMTQYDKLKAILREMFQMDQADLDFGIYRIMNARRTDIERFLDKELLPQVKEEFAKYRGTEIEEKKKELAQLEATIRDSGMNPDDAPKVKSIREDLAKYGDDDVLANEVFSHLTSFFRRYYDGGDFLSLRRYKKDTYAIPYEGEEVKLHWANADQYYIKTSQYLKDYAFKLSGNKRAHFKLVEAVQEKDNIKAATGKERRFMLHAEEPIRIEGQEVFIQFVYLPDKEKQDVRNKKTIEFINNEAGKRLKNFPELFTPAPTQKNTSRTLWEKHLTTYTARFNFDFFIHKDLGGFLRRELDFYIKNEVLFVDDLDALDDRQLKSAVAKVKVIKHIAQKIIAFLAQLEDFQKKLWLKKKFVVNCGYCVTLDRVPEELYPEIARNEEQHKEWVKLFAIDEIHGDLTTLGYSNPLTMEFLMANPYLVLDTKHFNESFKEKLLASFDNLDEATDGLIINSENFQALNLLMEIYREKVKCVYADPPFNTNEATFIYKNEYRHSSWCSMVRNSLALVNLLLLPVGVLAVAIDDLELHHLGMVCDSIFRIDGRLGMLTVEIKPSGRTNDNFLATSHEYYMFYGPNPAKAEIVFFELTDEQKQQYESQDDQGAYKWRDFLRTGGYSTPEERPNSYYPIYYNEVSGAISLEKYEGWLEIWPIDSEGRKRVWRKTPPSFLKHLAKKEIQITHSRVGELKVQIIDRIKSGMRPKSVWIGKQYDAASHGTKLLKAIMGEAGSFSFPKSVHATRDVIYIISGEDQEAIILDPFAGSGTTAHAVINLNREDDGSRKYILVEMGEYFDTVLKPRIQKVVYSKDWKDGKPVSREGISHMFKYMYLESYDDTLDNLKVIRTDAQENLIEQMSRTAREEYLLSYMLDVETRASDSLLNIDRFRDPFNYTLNIRRDNELKGEKIDLVETFNYLIGMYVEQTETIRGFKVVRGKLRTGEKTLIIWRNTLEKSNEDLDEFFQKQKYNTLDFEFDLIFVNGDNNLENLKIGEEKWKVRLIEEEFKKRMFEQAGG
ncbi:MAG: putative methyltransferase [Syntrophus sp. PtaB.Bin075]|nr:MAG: putative methyltransferase [Syntrophus sp. PtaB.Bin075]